MKILYVTTISNTVNAFLIPHIEMLVEKGHQVDVAFKTEQEISPSVIQLGCKVFEISFSRSPLNINNFKAYVDLKRIVIDGKYDIIHTHTPVASFVSRMVCKSLPGTKVIYTAHGFHFYAGAPLLNWIVYYPIEKWLSRYTDLLITINKEDYNLAKGFKAKDLKYVPGVGLNINKFSQKNVERQEKLRELGVDDNQFILLSVGELIKRKNHEAAIRAMAEIKNSDFIYLICGIGVLDKYLHELTESLGLNDKVKFLGFRKDVAELCNIADCLIFPSFQEGLPVAVMEAMSAGLPIICSRIRGNVDLIIENEGGYLFDPHQYMDISKCINKLFENPGKMKEMGNFNLQLAKQYDISNINSILADLYKQLY